jgi:hypothetical protein
MGQNNLCEAAVRVKRFLYAFPVSPSTPLPFSEFHVSLLSALFHGRLTSARRIIGFG